MENNLGSLKLLKSIGKGGMGEVFLAHDPICDREIAVKMMRPEWAENPRLKTRFLREAQVAAQLAHPSIIQIYSINPSGHYYTMPYIEGDTLKDILKTTKQQAKDGDPLHPIGSSIPALIRIFLSICGAVAFAHNQGVLHRDLKPENIIVGKFGEVIILDWGLARFLHEDEESEGDDESAPHLTKPGKVPGTLLYMAPERAFGEKPTVQADIYSLGVILYQLLTLHLPFQRNTLREYRKIAKYEKILPPEEVAPDREISPQLNLIAKKCLRKNPKNRYASMIDLIRDLEHYIEGLPQWTEAATLALNNKQDWKWQGPVALAKHVALTKGIENLEWVHLMLAKGRFPGNLQIEFTLIFEEGAKGFGLFFSAPDLVGLKGIEEGFLLWLAPEDTRLFRADVEVASARHLVFEKNRPYTIRIEKIGDHVRFFVEGGLKFGFLSHIPLQGAGMGLLMRDDKQSLSPMKVSMGSQNILINCLAVPDALLAKRYYKDALEEYRKIADSFPGRAEGREAIFRAGMTLLKEAKEKKDLRRQASLFQKALDEFEKLHNTPGAPLEYLGKSLIYKAQNDTEEEVKCLELALRKYQKHPLKHILVENILSRLEESGQNNRHAAFRFALLILQHLPHLPDTKKLSALLELHLDPLPFFTPTEEKSEFLAIQLAFWLNKPHSLLEMLKEPLSPTNHQNAQLALHLLGHSEEADGSVLKKDRLPILYARFELLLRSEEDPSTLPKKHLDPFLKLAIALYTSNWKEAKALLSKIPAKQKEDETSPFFYLYGCYLAHAKGEKAARAHLTSISEKAHPPIPSLLSHFLIGRLQLTKGWVEEAFLWEQVALYEQLRLYTHCLGKAL